MKIAYLILCHKNPQQVDKLINQLNDGNCDFYIHIDKKTSKFNLKDNDHIFLCPNSKRVDIQWATFSMIQATLNLIELLLRQKQNYDYICLLSGQDFPIKSNEYIQTFLSNNKGNNFIEIISHNHPYYKRYKKRVDIYYPTFLMKRNIVSKMTRRMLIYISGGYNNTFQILQRKYVFKKAEFGSQWWVLTYSCIEWIHNFLIENPQYIRFFENSATPDECFFQTLFNMSPYRATLRPKLMYLNWSENKNNPRILTKSDLENIKCESYCIFARKFDFTIDNSILELFSS